MIIDWICDKSWYQYTTGNELSKDVYIGLGLQNKYDIKNCKMV